MSNNPKLSVVIVSWNVKNLLRQTLASLYSTNQSIEFEVIVIDNNSNDHSAEMVNIEFPEVKLISNHQNRGFAKACNQGVKISSGEYLLFLNDDTKVFNNTLNNCVEYLSNHPEIGILGCSIKNSDGSQQLSVRNLPKLYDQIIVLLKLHNFFPKLIKNYLQKDFDYTLTKTVEQIMGAFLLIKRETYNLVGGFDNNYFIWYEEVDLCKRIQDHNLKIIYYAESKIMHYGGASFKQWKALPEQRLLNKSMLRYFFKHKPIWQTVILLMILPLNLFLALLVGGLEKFNLNYKNKHG